MTTDSAAAEVLTRDYNGMAISVTKLANSKHEYNAHHAYTWGEDEPIDTQYPVNVCALDSLREMEAWIDGYQQGAMENM